MSEDKLRELARNEAYHYLIAYGDSTKLDRIDKRDNARFIVKLYLYMIISMFLSALLLLSIDGGC